MLFFLGVEIEVEIHLKERMGMCSCEVQCCGCTTVHWYVTLMSLWCMIGCWQMSSKPVMGRRADSLYWCALEQLNA